MESRQIAWQAIEALLAVGGASLIVLLVWDKSSPSLHLWDDLWFMGLVVLLGALTALGAPDIYR